MIAQFASSARQRAGDEASEHKQLPIVGSGCCVCLFAKKKKSKEETKEKEQDAYSRTKRRYLLLRAWIGTTTLQKRSVSRTTNVRFLEHAAELVNRAAASDHAGRQEGETKRYETRSTKSPNPASSESGSAIGTGRAARSMTPGSRRARIAVMQESHSASEYCGSSP